MSTISEGFGADHRRCDALFEAAARAVAAGDRATAESRYAAFRTAIAAHMQAEEDYLFPALERHHGGPMGPVEVMRREHDELRDLLEELTAALDAAEAERFGTQAETLRALLSEHNLKEETVLYAVADQLPQSEREPALAALAPDTPG